MNKPLVSVIVPTYNRQDLLTETLTSILAQTYSNIEIIVVDNCSNYDFLAHIHSFQDNRLRPFQNRNHGVIATNRNFGIRQAQGKYIAFCDDDDLWLPEKLEEQLQIFEKHPDLNLVGTNASRFPDIKKNISYMWKDKTFSYKTLLRKSQSYLGAMGVTCSSVLYKANLTQEIGYWDENKDIVATEDYEYWLRILKYQDNSIYIMKKELIKYRWHANNTIKQTYSSRPNHYDRLAIIYAKQEHPLATKLSINLPYFEKMMRTQAYHYEGELSFLQVMRKQDIRIIDRCIIITKKILLSIV